MALYLDITATIKLLSLKLSIWHTSIFNFTRGICQFDTPFIYS